MQTSPHCIFMGKCAAFSHINDCVGSIFSAINPWETKGLQGKYKDSQLIGARFNKTVSAFSAWRGRVVSVASALGKARNGLSKGSRAEMCLEQYPVYIHICEKCSSCCEKLVKKGF